MITYQKYNYKKLYGIFAIKLEKYHNFLFIYRI